MSMMGTTADPLPLTQREEALLQQGTCCLAKKSRQERTPRNRRFLAILVISCSLLFSTVGLFAAYQYYFNQGFANCGGCVPQTNWWVNGTFYSHPDGTYIGQTTRASAISQVAVPDGSSDYDIRMQVRAVPDGISFLYLRATSNALAPNMPGGLPSQTAIGTFYSVQLEPDSGGTWAGISIRKQTTSGNTLLAATTVGCTYGSIHTLRAYVYGSTIGVWFDSTYLFAVSDTAITSGKPGIGLSNANLGTGQMIRDVQFYPIDRIAPAAISGSSVGISLQPRRVDMQWPAVSDDANGVGFWLHRVIRNGVHLADYFAPSFSDTTVFPGTTYTYTIYSADWHVNWSAPTTLVVTTPVVTPSSAGADPGPLRVGVRPTGSYWGAMGEQIDLMSGNLNYTMPLLKGMGRGGWGVTFALSYNSQLWRQDSGGIWKLGKDVGYGFGWKLQAGSITPVWSDPYTLHHYLFIDATGAEYWLDRNDSGVWTSREGVYVSYVAATKKLYFPDGSFWVMGCTSSGGEQDAGTLYPTKMQDTNGNQIIIRYQPGSGATWNDSSARILEIEDVRAKQTGGVGPYWTYRFTYNTDSIPHLVSYTNNIGTNENATLGYSASQALFAPFAPQQFGTTQTLQSISDSLSLSHAFGYSPSGTGELAQVTFPYGGRVRWEYQSFTFSGNKTVREVQNRYLLASSGGTEDTYAFDRNPADTAKPLRSWTA